MKKKKLKVILHMPHVSLKVPKMFYKGLLISKENFNIYNLKTSDVLIDTLFNDLKGVKIKPKYSRMFCDVERFKDDNKEIMSKCGQGMIYTHTYDGVLFHQHNDKYIKKVLKYYDDYHNKLDKITKRIIKKGYSLLILDLHSYSDNQAKYLNNNGQYPDICIGINDGYYDKEILDQIINIIKKKNLTYKINYPYSGSIIPNYIYNHNINNNVTSIMIEVNKRVYL